MTLLLALACSPTTTERAPVDHDARRAALHDRLAAEAGPAWTQPVPAVEAADPAHGAEVYTKTCAPCHGDQGAGDGPRAPALNPPPGNLRTTPLPEAGRLALVRDGSPGTGMAGYASRLREDDLLAVVRYLRTFQP